MAFPFSVYNIAYPAAGFKSQTHVYCNVIAKAVCLLPSHFLIRRSPEYSLPKQGRAATLKFSGRHRRLFLLLSVTVHRFGDCPNNESICTFPHTGGMFLNLCFIAFWNSDSDIFNGFFQVLCACFTSCVRLSGICAFSL